MEDLLVFKVAALLITEMSVLFLESICWPVVVAGKGIGAIFLMDRLRIIVPVLDTF
jgi:hypothetical protein